MEATIIGLDTAKRKMYLVACDKTGRTIFRHSCKSDDLLKYLSKQKPCLLVMEACGGSSYWARKIRDLGFEVKMVCASKVAKIRMNQKNDYNDCVAIVHLASRSDTKFISANESWQQDIQSLHRIRTSLVRRRVELVNQVHGLSLEYGVALPEGESAFRKKLIEELESGENEFSDLIRAELFKLYEEIKSVKVREKEIEKKLDQIAAQSADCQRLLKVPGVGPLTATAFLAAVGDPRNFKNGRQVSAWLGLVPKQYTTGGNIRLGRISKRGDSYVRQLLVHGGRAVLIAQGKRTSLDMLGVRLSRIKQERGFMKAAIAVANRNARVMWALLMNQTEYQMA